MKLFAAVYFMFLGWGIRKTDLDVKVANAIRDGWEAMQRRSAQIQLDERDKRLLADVALFSDSEAASASS